MTKTNFQSISKRLITSVIIKSPKKKINGITNIKLKKQEGFTHILEKKDHIKYLGVLIDDSISWKYQISYICSRISRNTGILLKLRNYLPLMQLKQLYYSLIMFNLPTYLICHHLVGLCLPCSSKENPNKTKPRCPNNIFRNTVRYTNGKCSSTT